MPQSHVRTSLDDASKSRPPKEAPASGKPRLVRTIAMVGLLVLLVALVAYMYYEPSGKEDYVAPPEPDPSQLPVQPAPTQPNGQPAEPGKPPPKIMAG